MPPKKWTKLISVDECPPGRAKFISSGAYELAIFHLANPDKFVVTQGACPHAGANLAAGELDGHVVTCHWHQWAFDLNTGECIGAHGVRLRTYESQVKNGRLWACLT